QVWHTRGLPNLFHFREPLEPPATLPYYRRRLSCFSWNPDCVATASCRLNIKVPEGLCEYRRFPQAGGASRSRRLNLRCACVRGAPQGKFYRRAVFAVSPPTWREKRITWRPPV